MFDSVLDKGNTPKTRFGLGTVISITLHVGILGLVVYLGSLPPAEKVEEAPLVMMMAAPPPPPPPPPPPAGGGAKPKTETPKKVKPVRRPDTIVQPKEIPAEKPAEADPSTEPEDAGVEGGVVGGVAGGVVGGVIGGVVGGTLGGTLGGTGTDVVPFGAGMTRPQFHNESGCKGAFYTKEARLANVEGTMIIKCRVNVAGRLENCRAIKPLPFVTEQALKILPSEDCRVTPVTFQGRPTAVDYVFNIRMKLQ